MNAPSPSVAVADVSRRSALQYAVRGVVAAGLALTAGGCGLRLDLPQPEPPVPTRRRAADESLLVSVIRDLNQVVAAEKMLVTGGTGSAGPRVSGNAKADVATLLTLHSKQVEVLTGRLTNVGVPLAEITAQPAPPLKPLSVPALATDLTSFDADRWEALVTATVTGRELLLSVYSVRLAGAVLLGRAVPMPKGASPAREGIVARTRPLAYAFEVVAAQSTGGQRQQAVSTLRRLQTLESEVVAGSTSSPTGWALPFAVTTPSAARRLATHVLSAAANSLVEVVGAAPTAASLQDAATWSARVQALGTDWSLPLTPFPATDR